VHLIAFHPRHRLRQRPPPTTSPDQPFENSAGPNLGMRHLASPEEDRRLHLVAVLEEALDVLLLELVVVLVDLRAELDLLDPRSPSGASGPFARRRFLLLVTGIFPEIHDAADRRHRPSARSRPGRAPFCLAMVSACSGGMIPSCAPVSSNHARIFADPGLRFV